MLLTNQEAICPRQPVKLYESRQRALLDRCSVRVLQHGIAGPAPCSTASQALRISAAAAADISRGDEARFLK